jgi:tetratricopeptide (TPR) repeat protein
MLKWMYPYLEPCGPILKLTPFVKTTLTEETVAKDMAFWETYIAQLERQPSFAGNSMARFSFAKLRVAIAGLYEHHKMYGQAEIAYRQVLQLAPTSVEAAIRYSGMLEKQEKIDEAIDVLRACSKHANQAGQPHRIDEITKRIEHLSTKK